MTTAVVLLIAAPLDTAMHVFSYECVISSQSCVEHAAAGIHAGTILHWCHRQHGPGRV